MEFELETAEKFAAHQRKVEARKQEMAEREHLRTIRMQEEQRLKMMQSELKRFEKEKKIQAAREREEQILEE